MNPSLQNSYLTITLNPERSSWSVNSPPTGLSLPEARLQVKYRCGQRSLLLQRWQIEDLSQYVTDTLHGAQSEVNLVLSEAEGGLRLQITFALPQQLPLLLWKIHGENRGSAPLYLDRLTLLEVEQPLPTSLAGREPAFFSNGWGSWNYTGAYGWRDHFRRTRLGPLAEPLRVNAGTPQPGRQGHFASDHFGLLGDRLTRQALLVGFLSQVEQFGSVEAWLRPEHCWLKLWANADGIRLDPGQSFSTDWACLQFVQLDAPDPLLPFLEAVFRQSWMQRRDPRPLKLTGWCSWYHYFSQVTAEDIRRNLQAAVALRQELPLDLIQIDDGFESQVGDWYSFRPTFPQGVAPLGEEIRQAGFTPGLWLAPFILDPRSQLAHAHPEWLLRGRWNRPVNAGFLFSGFFATALDLTAPGALEHVQEVIDTAAHRWGFPYLKLDFLYAAALPGRHSDPHLTRAQILRRGLQAIRQAAGEETLLLGCGCPLGPAVGLVDAMRIGPDVDVRWRPAYQGIEFFFEKEPDMPSARNSIHNILTRLPLHRRWWVNDPDCLLVRPDTHLSQAELQTLATAIALSDGAFFLSDDLAALPPERLRLAGQLLPSLGQAARPLDWFDGPDPSRLRLDLNGPAGEWSLLALINWADAPQPMVLRLSDYDLPAGAVWGREFWSNQVLYSANGEFSWPLVPAHGVILLAVRRVHTGQPQYLGSDLHLSQGQEVTHWEWSPAAPARLTLSLERPGQATGLLDLALPEAPHAAWLDNRPLDWLNPAAGVYRLAVAFTRRAELRLEFEDRKG